jgi:hypothetical protein
VRCSPLLPAVTVALALAAGPTAGCALVGDPCEAPVTGSATYVSGSTPPPWHHEWTVRLEGSAGTVTWTPGYGSPEAWSVAFVPDPGAVSAACRELRDAPDAETPPGGGTLTVRWRGAGGRTTGVTTSDAGPADVVRGAVPAAAWAEAQTAYERWRDTQAR